MTLIERIKTPNPRRIDKLANSILVTTSGLSVLMMSSPLPEKWNTWIIFCLNATGMLCKGLSYFFKETPNEAV